MKRVLAEKKVGHCGTLDPLAQGVLLVLFGKATREQEHFLGLDKQYWLRAEFGRATTTGDQDGESVPCPAFTGIVEPELRSLVSSFEGEQRQTPPLYAALKYKGKPYYKWAREGVEVPRESRSIKVYAFDLLSLDNAHWEARVTCSRGTYVRTLVEDIAARLGTGGVLTALVRERIGDYNRSSAVPLAQLEKMSRNQLLTLCDQTIHHHSGNI